MKIFIHTNNKQGLGAILSKYSFEKNSSNSSVDTEFINVDNLEVFKKFVGKKYKRSGREVVYDPNDLQSFTLSRFMPPQIMGYEGKALVIDPDVFAVTDVNDLLTIDLQGKAIAACRKKDAWDTSVMVLDCSKLKHWRIENILEDLMEKKLDYANLMTLKQEDQSSILEIPRIWNSLDTLTPETKMIHMTNRLTQPWKTGLPIDFTIAPMPKFFGIIPREPVHKILGKYPTHYQKHPNEEIEKLFFGLVKDAVNSGSLTKNEIANQISLGYVREDLLEKVF